MLQQQEFMQREIHESHEGYLREAIEAASHIEATELHQRMSTYYLEAVHWNNVLKMESKARSDGQLQNGQLLYCESGFNDIVQPSNTMQSRPKSRSLPGPSFFAIDGLVCAVLCVLSCLSPLLIDETQEWSCFPPDMA